MMLMMKAFKDGAGSFDAVIKALMGGDIMGALNIITAGGSPEKVTTGRNYIMYAVIGLIVALLAWELPNIVKAVAGFR
jgi:hypothetical protein